ncbi:hypothetical protein GCM10011428_23570 [Streptomyces violaceus]
MLLKGRNLPLRRGTKRRSEPLRKTSTTSRVRHQGVFDPNRLDQRGRTLLHYAVEAEFERGLGPSAKAGPIWTAPHTY